MSHLYRGIVLLVMSASCVLLSASQQLFAAPSNGPAPSSRIVDRVTQIGTFERLSQGEYDGDYRVYQLLQTADFGIGTFEGLDGEMILLGGVVYHAPASGKVHRAAAQERIPFATVTRFRSEQRIESAEPLADYAALQAHITSVLPDSTQILAIRIHGTFANLKLRAPQKQNQPYPVLTEALKGQTVFERNQVTGTFVGFRFPTSVGSLNAPGYHFHFLSDDRKLAGHVLEASSVSFAADVETIERYDVLLAAGD